VLLQRTMGSASSFDWVAHGILDLNKSYHFSESQYSLLFREDVENSGCDL
jgi:hypothetical protein